MLRAMTELTHAQNMRAGFTDTPDATPYVAVEPTQSLFEKTPRLAALDGPARAAAVDTLRMRFDVPDAAPSGRLNRILWGVVRLRNRSSMPCRAARFTGASETAPALREPRTPTVLAVQASVRQYGDRAGR